MREDGWTCENCVFWLSLEGKRNFSDGYGECRRYAPKSLLLAPGGRDNLVVWPFTRDDEWCGELQPKPGSVDIRDSEPQA